MGVYFFVEFDSSSILPVFFAEGGLSCLEKHGNQVTECVNEHNTDEHQEDLCM